MSNQSKTNVSNSVLCLCLRFVKRTKRQFSFSCGVIVQSGFITVRYSSYRNIMFSQASVILSTGGMHGRGACVAGWFVWQGGMHGRGYICGWGGMCGGGMHGEGGIHGMGACMAGGHACQWGGGGACVAGETVTAADGTYPIGMHSCVEIFPVVRA